MGRGGERLSGALEKAGVEVEWRIIEGAGWRVLKAQGKVCEGGGAGTQRGCGGL